MPELEPLIRVYFDASRMISRRQATPTGIDRVDLAYARHLAKMPGFDLRLMRFDAFGPRLLHRHEAEELVGTTVRRWKLAQTQGLDHPAWRGLCAWLNTADHLAASRVNIEGERQGLLGEGGRGHWRRILSGSRPIPSASRRIPTQSAEHPRVYLNTSHGRLFRSRVSRWLAATGMPAVFFVHDLIPIEFPQFNRPREPLRHKARLQTISRHARQVLVNSQATADSLGHFLGREGQRVPDIQVAALGVERVFSAGRLPELSPARPYFVVLGTIEPRKNHALLLDVWRRWIAADPDGAARLVVIGRRGWMNQEVFRQLEDPALAAHVVECGGLSDRQVEALVSGACALLCPSHAEGFSLPVVEALASGAPVIASDIPAHREVHQGCAELLPTNDAGHWLSLVQAYASPGSPRRAMGLHRIEAFRTSAWEDHFSIVVPRLEQVARGS